MASVEPIEQSADLEAQLLSPSYQLGPSGSQVSQTGAGGRKLSRLFEKAKRRKTIVVEITNLKIAGMFVILIIIILIIMCAFIVPLIFVYEEVDSVEEEDKFVHKSLEDIDKEMDEERAILDRIAKKIGVS